MKTTLIILGTLASTFLNSQIVITNSTNVSSDTINLEGKTMMLKKVKCGATPEEINAVKDFTMITIGKRITLSDMDKKDTLFSRKIIASESEKSSITILKVEEESNKLNIQLMLPEKGYTELFIYDMYGKIIYQDVINNFQGLYEKKIDLNLTQRSIYYIKVQQGKNYKLKKILVE